MPPLTSLMKAEFLFCANKGNMGFHLSHYKNFAGTHKAIYGNTGASGINWNNLDAKGSTNAGIASKRGTFRQSAAGMV